MGGEWPRGNHFGVLVQSIQVSWRHLSPNSGHSLACCVLLYESLNLSAFSRMGIREVKMPALQG